MSVRKLGSSSNGKSESDIDDDIETSSSRPSKASKNSGLSAVDKKVYSYPNPNPNPKARSVLGVTYVPLYTLTLTLTLRLVLC